VAFKWENNEHGVPIATRDDGGRKPSQTRQNRVAKQPQPVVAKPSRTGLLTVFWRALWWSLRACVRIMKATYRACRKWGVEIVAPTFTLGLYVFSAWLSNRDTFKGLWFSGAKVNAGDGERGVVGGGLVWTDLHIAGWWVVPVAIVMVGAWAMSAVRQDDQRKSQRFAMLGFVATVPVFAFVVARVGGDRWWLPIRVALAGMTPTAAVVWVLRSPIDDTARGFRRNVRDHRLRRLWQGRVDRAVATLGGAVRVEVTRVRENKLTADVTLRVETLDETTGAAVAARLAELGPSMWPRVRWADNSVSPLAPGSVRASVDKRDAAKVSMTVLRGDAFAKTITRDPVQVRSIEDGIPFGRDARGREIVIPTRGSHCLIGGQTGSGKSVGMSHVLHAATSAPDAQLWAVDLKEGVEIAAWKHLAYATATTGTECLAMLEMLDRIRVERLREMSGAGLRDWVVSPDKPRIILTVDERRRVLPFERRRAIHRVPLFVHVDHGGITEREHLERVAFQKQRRRQQVQRLNDVNGIDRLARGAVAVEPCAVNVDTVPRFCDDEFSVHVFPLSIGVRPVPVRNARRARWSATAAGQGETCPVWSVVAVRHVPKYRDGQRLRLHPMKKAGHRPVATLR